MRPEPNTDDCPADLIPTRKSLLGRLKNFEDNVSWRDFFNTYWRLIYGFAIQRGLNLEEAQEVVQKAVVAPVHLQGELERLLRRRIAERMQRTTSEVP